MPFRSVSYGLLALLICLSGASAIAEAQPKAPSCGEKPSCARLADEAYEASSQGRFDDAKRAYDRAYQQVPDPTLLYNLARVLHKAGKPAAAATYYQKYLDNQFGGSEAQRTKAQQYLEQARREAVFAPLPSSSDSSTKTPVYRKWWLWTAVGVAAAGIALGVGLGVASRGPDTSNAYRVKPFPN